MQLPRLYAIVDRTVDSSTDDVIAFARELFAGGVSLIQYRNKQGSAAEMLMDARELKRIAMARVKQDEIEIVMNDRADICVAAGLNGVHLGQNDLSVEGGRALCPKPRIVGVSTHNLEQLEAA